MYVCMYVLFILKVLLLRSIVGALAGFQQLQPRLVGGLVQVRSSPLPPVSPLWDFLRRFLVSGGHVVVLLRSAWCVLVTVSELLECWR